MRLSSLFLLGSNLALGAYAASVQLVNPPAEVKLNDRKHPITVAYEGVNGEVRIVCMWIFDLGGRGVVWTLAAGREGGRGVSGRAGLFHISILIKFHPR